MSPNSHQDSQHLRTPLKRVRGLGSAKQGSHHWWLMRLSSVALVPLTLWFVWQMMQLQFCPANHLATYRMGESCTTVYAAATAWAAHPVNAILLILLTVTMFHHAALGMQVVIEDYVHKEGQKLAAIYAVKGGLTVLALACLFSILKLALVK